MENAPSQPGYATLGQLHVLDLEGDGDLDLTSNATGGHAIHLFVNDGTGRFTNEGLQRIRPSMPIAAYVNFAVGYVDGDGDPDFVGGRAFVLQQPDLFMNDGSGYFDDASARIPAATMWPRSRSLGDLDEDGDLDLLIVGSSLLSAPGIGGEFVLVNDGTGYFADRSREFFPRMQNGAVHGHAVGDLDGDGDLDVIIPEIGSGPTRWCRTRYFVNLSRQLHAPTPPARGGAWAVEIWGPASGQAVLALAAREASLPLGRLGTFGLDPTTTLLWPAPIALDSRRRGTVSIPIPTGLPIGTTLYAQAVVFDPARNGQERLTNVWDDVVR